MNIVSCKQAKELGLKRYFTGKPCKHGHLAERHVTGGCIICANVDQRRYYAQGPEKYKYKNKLYFQRVETKFHNKIRQRLFYLNNKELCRSVSAKCRAQRWLRVPAWSQKEEIAEFYKNCPDGYEVDHVVPLLGKQVSGLHVIENLQYLTATENRAKHNKFEVLV